ncbi:hypothetical protein CB1_000154012 [Camelus ferus]|nr:hypothetical protein CB1_000154012 [Camelus ferus]
MPGSMAPLKKTRNTTKLPLALNPLKSKDVLAVLAERNQAVVPVGVWVEPAPLNSSEVPAYTSAYMIEEELKEQLRKKQEALKHFQRQVKRRVNQQIRLRKKQELQKSYEAEVPCRKPAFIKINIGTSGKLPFEVQQDLLTPVHDQKFMEDQESDSEESPSIMIDKKGKENLSWGDQQDLLSEDKDITFNRVQKVQFKNPLSAMTEEKEVEQLRQDILPKAQDYLPEAQGDLLQSQGDLIDIQSVELEAWSVEPRPSTQDMELEGQAVKPKAQAVKAKTRSVLLKTQSVELEEGNIVLEGQGFLPPNQAFLHTGRNGSEAFPLDVHQDLHRHQDEAFTRGKKVRFKESCCDMTSEKERDPSLAGYQYLPPKLQDQAFIRDEIEQNQKEIQRDKNKYSKQPSSFEKWEIEKGIASGVPSICFTQCSRPSLSQTHRNYGQASPNMTDEKWRKELFLEHHEYVLHEIQNPGSAREQSLYSKQQLSFGRAEQWQDDLLLDGHHHRPPQNQREVSIRRQVGGGYQSGLNTEYQTPLAFQSGVNQEEDKKERQKQYLRYRRLFMDIEREQVKEQHRQKEQRKKIEKIKKKKEQQRYAEEQRILRMKFPEEPCSGEKMSEILAQLQLEEVKGARVKQQREKEHQRYVEALRAQIQEKMQLYNITLPPLCCCGPDFWDAHPDTCANNCIFYKNHRDTAVHTLQGLRRWFRGFILLMTFLIYTTYHMSRKPISVVKQLFFPGVSPAAPFGLFTKTAVPGASRLHQNCSGIIEPVNESHSLNDSTWCNWAPFDQSNYKELLGAVDNAFLVAYAIGMFISGIFGERLPLRYYLSAGMLLSGLFTSLFGLGYFWNIHVLWYFVLIQVSLIHSICNGLVQTTGWPSVVTCVGNWFGKGKRGLIMGIWNSHTSVGNILGSLVAGVWVDGQWGLSFVVPGIVIAIMGLVTFFFLVESGGSWYVDVPIAGLLSAQGEPEENLDNPEDPANRPHANKESSLESAGSGSKEPSAGPAAISFFGALRIPGVIEFSLCLLFAKLVSYTFLYWLPLYIFNVVHFSAKEAGDLSTLFDVGGIIGGILAGLVSDYTNGRATTCCVMLILAAPMMFLYNYVGQNGISISIVMLIICGALVNGPYALITTAVSADLGTHKSLKGNAKALSTVTAIIDGTGSIGAALGPLLAGLISPTGWNNVFYMLISADILACLLLCRLVYKEILAWRSSLRRDKGLPSHGRQNQRSVALHVSEPSSSPGVRNVALDPEYAP